MNTDGGRAAGVVCEVVPVVVAIEDVSMIKTLRDGVISTWVTWIGVEGLGVNLLRILLPASGD